MQDAFSLENFTGLARLFPLPNLVVFPHVVQPLHIFESRYIEMLEDAVADDFLLAMGLLMPGWEAEYESRPPVDPYVCLGKIMSHAPAKEEGHYNILLGGVSRARIVEELPAKRSYREVRLELLEDVEPDANDPEVPPLHANLVQAFRRLVPAEVLAEQHLNDLLDKQSHLGTLTDLISYSIPLDLPIRQFLLAETNVMQRTKLLVEQLQNAPEIEDGTHKFPPDFSVN